MRGHTQAVVPTQDLVLFTAVPLVPEQCLEGHVHPSPNCPHTGEGDGNRSIAAGERSHQGTRKALASVGGRPRMVVGRLGLEGVWFTTGGRGRPGLDTVCGGPLGKVMQE